jgi:hypothetical protein
MDKKYAADTKKLKDELEKFKAMYHRDVVISRKLQLENRKLKREVSRLKQTEQKLTQDLKRRS